MPEWSTYKVGFRYDRSRGNGQQTRNQQQKTRQEKRADNAQKEELRVVRSAPVQPTAVAAQTVSVVKQQAQHDAAQNLKQNKYRFS